MHIWYVWLPRPAAEPKPCKASVESGAKFLKTRDPQGVLRVFHSSHGCRHEGCSQSTGSESAPGPGWAQPSAAAPAVGPACFGRSGVVTL